MAKLPPAPPMPNRAAGAVARGMAQQNAQRTANPTQARPGVGSRPAAVIGREVAAKQQAQSKQQSPTKTPPAKER